jgi:chemotaxis protein CheX
MLLNGVRNANAPVLENGRSGGEHRMGVSLRESVELVADPRNLDASVEEVFATMLGLECRRQEEGVQGGSESVTAVVGFGGQLSGACVFSCPAAAAKKIAAQMTGLDFADVDDTVKDAVGELCNMLAGSWKGRIPGLAANCGLSVPAVITGRDYHLHVQAPEFQLRHVYRFDDAAFAVTIVCDGLL